MKRVLCAMSLISLSGCMTSEPVSLTLDQDLIESRLRLSAEKAAKAQEQLAIVEAGRTPRVTSQIVHLNDVSEALRKPLSLTWDGPLEPLVRKISESIGYRVNVLGKAPAVPIVVNLDVQKKASVEVVREIGHQARGKADIHLNSQTKAIEVRYAPIRY